MCDITLCLAIKIDSDNLGSLWKRPQMQTCAYIMCIHYLFSILPLTFWFNTIWTELTYPLIPKSKQPKLIFFLTDESIKLFGKISASHPTSILTCYLALIDKLKKTLIFIDYIKSTEILFYFSIPKIKLLI